MLTSLTLASLAAALGALLSAIVGWRLRAPAAPPGEAASCPPGSPDAPLLPLARPNPRIDPFAGLRRASAPLYFAVLDLARFTATRETVGFEIADAVLAHVRDVLCATLSEVNVGRTGQSGIEFSFTAIDDEHARTVLARCLRRLEEPASICGIGFRLGGTFACAPIGRQGAVISNALLHSVQDAVVRDGSDKVRWVAAPASVAPGLDDVAILRALPGAMAAGELTFHYQPKFDCRQGRITGAEGLLRWPSPTLGFVPTQQIVLLAERTGAIRDLTLWGIEQATRDQTALIADGHDLTLSVNLSGVLLPDRAFMLDLLDKIRAAPGRIGIEITETAMIDDPEAAIENLAAYASAGVPVAIDDFGAGLSSLTYLKRLPAGELKIDRQFVMGLTDSHRDPLIVRASIDLAHALEMTVTAEGVEDSLTLSLLRVMGCDELQGYFIAKPMPLEKLTVFLAAEHRHLDLPDVARSAPRLRPTG